MIEPRREVHERANEERDRYRRAIDIRDFEKLFAGWRLESVETRERCRALLWSLGIQVVHHYHSPQRGLLGEEAARASRGDVFQ